VKVISAQECQEWLDIRFGRGSSWQKMEADYATCVTYQLPIDTGVKTAIARIVCQSISTDQPGLFWISAWRIFPSSQNMALFDGYRTSFGEHRPIHAAPGHLFGESDLRHIECLLDLALYFYWDASLFDGAGTIVVRTSHDEFVSIHAKDEERLKLFQRNLEGLKLKQTN
jgi:hypothetical protein